MERFEKLKIRALTIIIGVPIVLFIIHLGGYFFYLAVILIALLGFLELREIFKNKDYYPSFIIGLATTLFFLLQKTLSKSPFFHPRFVFTILLFLILTEHLLKNRQKSAIINIALTLFIAVYIGHFLSFLIDITLFAQGKMYLIFALFTTWMSDTAAYIVGVNFGRRHPFPSISPNKTLEGSVGGIIGGILCGLAFTSLLPLMKWSTLMILGGTAAISGQIGDLFESMIKRNFEVKDSGKLFPGHGGILDCMDSILFSIPILYFCLFFMTQ